MNWETPFPRRWRKHGGVIAFDLRLYPDGVLPALSSLPPCGRRVSLLGRETQTLALVDATTCASGQRPAYRLILKARPGRSIPVAVVRA